MIEYTIKEATLDNPEEVIEYAQQLEAASKKLTGPNASKTGNTAEYLKCKSYLTDRNHIIILNQEINIEPENNNFSDLITAIPQDYLDKFTYEKPVYQNIYSGLIAKLLACKYFFREDWSSRKLVQANTDECITLTKLYIHNNQMYIIAFIRSSSNRLLHIDFIGLVFTALDLLEEYHRQLLKESGETKKKFIKMIKKVNLSMQIADYHHIG